MGLKKRREEKVGREGRRKNFSSPDRTPEKNGKRKG